MTTLTTYPRTGMVAIADLGLGRLELQVLAVALTQFVDNHDDLGDDDLSESASEQLEEAHNMLGQINELLVRGV